MTNTSPEPMPVPPAKVAPFDTLKNAVAIFRDLVFIVAIVLYSIGFVSQNEYLSQFGLHMTATDLAPAQLLTVTFNGLRQGSAGHSMIISLALTVLLFALVFYKVRRVPDPARPYGWIILESVVLALLIVFGTITTLRSLYTSSELIGAEAAAETRVNGCAGGEPRLITAFTLKPEAEKLIDPEILEEMHAGDVRIVDEDDQNYYIILTVSRMPPPSAIDNAYKFNAKYGIWTHPLSTVAIRKDSVISWSVLSVPVNPGDEECNTKPQAAHKVNNKRKAPNQARHRI